MKIVLQKYIAQSGECSRRQAELLISSGKVLVDGQVAELGMRVSGDEKITVDGFVLSLSKSRIYIKMNKPAGFTCTNRSFKDEKNIFDLIDIDERLFSVGRLDKNSRGLIVLTNDGDFANKLAHPRYEHEKKYQVRIKNQGTRIKKEEIDTIISKFKKGIDIGDGDGIVKARDIKYLNENIFEIILTTGKKRQIRRMFKALDHEVDDLVRISEGEIKLGDLGEGKWKPLSRAEISKLINI